MPTIVRTSDGFSFEQTSFPLTYSEIGSAAPTNGNRIVAIFVCDIAVTAASTGSNTLTQRATRAGSGSANLYVFDSTAISGSPTTISFTFSGTGGGWMMVWELSGADELDFTFNGTGSGSSASVSFTTTRDAATVLGMWAAINNGGMTPGSGYTALGGAGNWERWMQRSDAGTAGSKEFNATWVNSPTWYGIGAAYATASGPTITSHPSNDEVTEPAPGSFSVSATGTGTLSYQWQVNDGGGWVNVSSGSGGTTASYTTGATSVAMNGYQYRCNVTDDNGTTASNAATLTVNGAAQIILAQRRRFVVRH